MCDGVDGRLIHSWSSEFRRCSINLETLDYTEPEPQLNNWIRSMARIGDQPRRVKTLCSVPGVVGEKLRCRSYGLQSTSGNAIADATMRSFQRIPEHSSELNCLPETWLIS